jgi:hypothetical protein
MELFSMPVVVRRDMPEGVVCALVGERDGVALLDDGSIVRHIQTGPHDLQSVSRVFRPNG